MPSRKLVKNRDLDIEIIISSTKLNLGKYENYDKKRPQFARENELLLS